MSPSVLGFLRDETGSFTSGLLYMVFLLVVSIVCVRQAVDTKRARLE